MKKSRFTEEQIIGFLKQADAVIRADPIAEAAEGGCSDSGAAKA